MVPQLQGHGIAVPGADVPSNDSFIKKPSLTLNYF
jgi:hypothetical protein